MFSLKWSEPPFFPHDHTYKAPKNIIITNTYIYFFTAFIESKFHLLPHPPKAIIFVRNATDNQPSFSDETMEINEPNCCLKEIFLFIYLFHRKFRIRTTQGMKSEHWSSLLMLRVELEVSHNMSTIQYNWWEKFDIVTQYCGVLSDS